jgi:hypothetical protein
VTGGGPPGSSCAGSNACTPQSFAQAILQYPGIGGPVTPANLYAIEAWERAEGGGAGCPGQPPHAGAWQSSAGPAGNPLNTTQREPGSVGSWNSVNVQIYGDAAGHTCWYWGIKANGDTLLNGFYPQIVGVLQHPAASNSAQCLALAAAVGSTPWGTGNFQSAC